MNDDGKTQDRDPGTAAGSWDDGLVGLLDPEEPECLLCYVYRLLGLYGCHGLLWARRYRDERAPKVLGLERRLGAIGGYCDCEIFLNGYELAGRYLRELPDPFDAEDPDIISEPLVYAAPMPGCLGARRGSTKPCGIWTRIRRW